MPISFCFMEKSVFLMQDPICEKQKPASNLQLKEGKKPNRTCHLQHFSLYRQHSSIQEIAIHPPRNSMTHCFSGQWPLFQWNKGSPFGPGMTTPSFEQT